MKNPFTSEAVIDIITQRRIAQQLANRIDRVGAILDAKVTKDNANTVTGWVDTALADIDAAAATPVLYVDTETAKAFEAIK